MPAPKLYNNATQQWDIVPDHMVTDNIANGKYSFESGIQVPAVDPQGNLVNIPSEHVQEAFQNGYRWGTDADTKANIEAQNEAIMEKNYGDGHGIQALGLGAVEGAIPGADYFMQGLASTMGGSPQDITQGAQQLATRNPGMHFAGELAGAVSSPITEVLGGGARAIGEEAATSAFGAAAKTLPGKMAVKGIGSALEGGYFGLHDGLNESALGDPQDVAETLMSSAGQGLIFGGLAGAAFPAMGEAARPIKNFIGDKVDTLTDAAKKTAQLVTKGTTLPTLPQDIREAAGNFIGNEDLRNLIYSGGGMDAVKSINSDLASSTAELKDQSSDLLSQLKDFVKRSPRDTQEKIDNALTEAGGDFYRALDESYDTYQGQRTTLMADMLHDTSPSMFMGDVDSSAGKLIKTLSESKNADAQALAGSLNDYLEAEKTAAGMANVSGKLENGRMVYDQDAFAGRMTAGKEMNVMQQLRERLGGYELPDDLQGKVDAFQKDLTDNMVGHPVYGDRVQALDNQYQAMDKLRDFVTDQTGNRIDLMSKLKTDPEFAHEMDSLMSQFPDTAPTIQNFKDAVEDPLAKQAQLNALKQATRDAGANTYGRLKTSDYLDLAKMFGDADIGQKSDRLREIQEAMNGQDTGVISKLTANLRALGRPVPKIFSQLEPHQAGLEKLMDTLGKAGDQSVIEKVLRKGTFGLIKGKMLGLGADLVGGAIGHSYLHGPLGVVAGSLTSAVVRRLFNPISSFEALTKLEGRLNKNARILKEATNFAIDALTSDTARRVTIRGGAFTPSTTEEKRANWSNRAQFLTSLQDPDKLSQVAQDRLGTCQAAPNITTAMHAQFARTVNFLADKVPQDPTAHLTLNAHDSDWKPSDMELAKFERYHQAAVDPVSAIENIGTGRATQEELHTLETLYPSTFKRLQDGLLDAIMSPDTKLSYSQRQKIGSMFGIAASVSSQPTFVAAMQANFNNTPGSGFKPQGIKSNPKVAFDPQSNSTETERITYQS